VKAALAVLAPGVASPAVLDIFRCEVRFYQEIAPVIGVRVPACYRAEATDDGTLLELEDLSSWPPGADPAPARVLVRIHELWPGQRLSRWPWLRQPGPAVDAAVDLLAALYDQMVGRVPAAESAASAAGPLVLTHGDASAQNMRTSPGLRSRCWTRRTSG
jgi:hypothetical protein